jgi:nucleotide-binding universal stress UspA family protein
MEADGFRKILVAFDGSEDSVRATRVACAIAKRFGSNVVIAHVYSFAVFAYGGASPMPMPDVTPLEDAARLKGRSILDRGIELAKDAGLSAAGELMEASSTVQALVEYAAREKVDLIVVGTRGTTGFKKLIMGSVSSGLASHADCPVLVVR